MNIKILECIYKEDHAGLSSLFKTQGVPPDHPINDVRNDIEKSHVVWNDGFASHWISNPGKFSRTVGSCLH